MDATGFRWTVTVEYWGTSRESSWLSKESGWLEIREIHASLYTVKAQVARREGRRGVKGVVSYKGSMWSGDSDKWQRLIAWICEMIQGNTRKEIEAASVRDMSQSLKDWMKRASSAEGEAFLTLIHCFYFLHSSVANRGYYLYNSPLASINSITVMHDSRSMTFITNWWTLL